MNPLALLAWWREILIVLLLAAAGIQSYRLQGEQGAHKETRAAYTLYKTKVEAAATAAQQEADAVGEAEALAKLEADYEHQRKVARLERDAASLRARLRDELARRDLVPAAPAASPGGGDVGAGAVCFSRERLAEGLRGSLERAAGRFAALAQRGARGLADFDTCARWALKLHGRLPELAGGAAPPRTTVEIGEPDP